MFIIMIRRFVRPDREREFLANYEEMRPRNNPAFLGETLTKVVEDAGLPAQLRGFALNGVNCLTYVNIARWTSHTAFMKQFTPESREFDPKLETAARQRVVLSVEREHAAD